MFFFLYLAHYHQTYREINFKAGQKQIESINHDNTENRNTVYANRTFTLFVLLVNLYNVFQMQITMVHICRLIPFAKHFLKLL